MLAEVVRRTNGATTMVWPTMISGSDGRRPRNVKYISAASPKASMGRIIGDMKNVSSVRTHLPERRASATEARVARTVAAVIATSATSRLLSAARWIWLDRTGSNRSWYHWSDRPDGGNLIERPSVNDVSSTITTGPLNTSRPS